MNTQSVPVSPVPRALSVCARWLRGEIGSKEAVRDLVALGFTPDEAFDVLAAGKLGEGAGLGCGPSRIVS